MSYQCKSQADTALGLLRGASPVQAPDTDSVDRQQCEQNGPGSLPFVGGSNRKSCLQSFLHYAPVRCIEAVVHFLDLPSFVVLLSLNSSLLQLCDSSAFQPCWTHFALVQRVLRHGENILLPSASHVSLSLLRGDEHESTGRAGARGSQTGGYKDDKEKANPCQTFSRLLPRVTRLDLIRIGSLNSNWRNKSFSSEQRQVICSGEALDKAYVLPAPPFASSLREFSVAPDAPLNLQACPSVGLPACLQPLGVRDSFDVSPIFTLLPSTRIFAVHAAARTPRGQFIEVKLPLLPTKIPIRPDPLIKFGGHAPKGWLLGEDNPLQVAPSGRSEGSRPTTRISQSQRKKKQRQQRQQQAHRLHMSWVHVAPHPIHPCPKDLPKAEQSRCSSREGSPPLFTASSPGIPNGKSWSFTGGSSPCVHDADAGEAIGHCPLVRLLCLCLPPIEIEKTPATDEDGSRSTDPDENRNETVNGTDAKQIGEDPASTIGERSTSYAVLKGAIAPMEPPVAHTNSATACSLGDEKTFPEAAAAAAPVDSALCPTALTREDRAVPSPPEHVWPVALCSYSPKGSRFLAHAVVCCALREGEKLVCARSRLWYKDKKPRTLRCSISRTPTGVSEVAHEFCSRAPVNGEQNVLPQPDTPNSSSSSIKTISFSIQQHPLAVFVGMVAVGTSEGRILCTPPPCCLVRSCYCGKRCLAALRSGASGAPSGDPSCCGDMESPHRSIGLHLAGGQKPFSRDALSNPQVEQKEVLGPSGNYSPVLTAAKAGCGVAFVEVGNFGEGSGAVNHVELVRGTPWAPHVQQHDKAQLLTPTQKRDYSWHWTRPPSARPERRKCGDLSVECVSASGAPCGGLEAEALWLFACSKETGIKIFRFMWSSQDDALIGTSSAKYNELRAACGRWKCVLTIRGSCQLVSLDLNNGIVAVCTPTDSKVYFLCFRVRNNSSAQDITAIRIHFVGFVSSRCTRAAQAANLDCAHSSASHMFGTLVCPAVLAVHDYLIHSVVRVSLVFPQHLLPAHVYLPNTIEPPSVSAQDLAFFDRCGLPRPQHIPLGGFLASPQRQFTSLLQSPTECARLELLVARRPSVLQPLGGRRWVVIDGSVIRVVQIKVKDVARQRNPRDSERQELPHSNFEGVPREQLLRLRFPVFDEPELSWTVGPPPPPELQAVRLCVFSHPRTIYHCAFDGVRRLVTVDLREVLMIWDLQRYTKLCDVDLMASKDSGTPGLSCSHDIEGYDGDGGDICMSSDGLCSENDAFRRNSSRKGGGGGQSVGAKSRNARNARKGAKLSLKKQFGSDWMQKHVLAHRNMQHHQGYCVLSTAGHSSNASSSATSSHASVIQGEGVSVGGVWFNSCSLIPAVQLQSMYDTQRETGNHQSSSRPMTNAFQQGNMTCNDSRVEADEMKPGSSSEDLAVAYSHGQRRFQVPEDLVMAQDEVIERTSASDKGALVDAESSTAVAVSYADDFPPLSTESRAHLGGTRKRDNTLPRALGTPLTQHAPAEVSYTSARDSSSATGLSVSGTHPKEFNAASSGGLRRTLSGGPSSGEQHVQQSRCRDRDKCTDADDSGRPSFAAVVAAAASSRSRNCPRSGWASGPTDTSLFIGLLGEEGARALQESAAALGMSVEDFYLQQVAQWEQLQRRSNQRVGEEGNSPPDQRVECSVDGLASSSDGNVKMADAVQPPVGGLQDSGNAFQAGVQSGGAGAADEAFAGSDVESSRGSRTSGSPSTHAAPSTPEASPIEESDLMLQAAACRHPGPRSRSRMVGLLGMHRCVARLGPNAQRRHITALCLSETCIALLFKNLKTWQIWTFAPSAGLLADANETFLEKMY